MQILIVGGLGAMGRRLTDAFRAHGHVVNVYDRDDPRDLTDAVRAGDIVMIAVPMHIACETVDRVAPLLRDDALLCDINSSKGDICARMRAQPRGEALGLHPMFGPSVSTLRGQKMVVCPVRPGPRADALLRTFDAMGLERIEADPDDHDRVMALVQVLTHFSTIVMGEALRASGVDLRESLRFTSPIYRLELAFVGRLFAQSSDLYAEILMTNPRSGETLDAFRDAADRLGAIVRSGDREAFRDVFADVAAYFADFATEAMATSDRVIDAIVDDGDTVRG
ncbi:MAG: hypothetical protein Tsb0013_07580 [Phycisphaerales bacterium]